MFVLVTMVVAMENGGVDAFCPQNVEAMSPKESRMSAKKCLKYTRSKSSNAFRANRAGSEAYDFPGHAQLANPSKRQIEGQNVECQDKDVMFEKRL